MSQYKLTNKYPVWLIGNITLDTVANFAAGDVVTGGTSNATAKVLKIKGTTLVVNNINGTFAVAETVTNTGTGTGVVAANGFDLSIESKGIFHNVYKTGGRVLKELVIGIRDLVTKVTDVATPPSFTAAVTYSGTAAMITDDVITITLTSTEDVKVGSGAYINVTIGANTRRAMYNSAASADLSHPAFTYTIVAGDTALATEVVVGTSVVGGVVDIVLNSGVGVAATFSAPNTSTATAN